MDVSPAMGVLDDVVVNAGTLEFGQDGDETGIGTHRRSSVPARKPARLPGLAKQLLPTPKTEQVAAYEFSAE
jgi:hypothetical protein